MGNEFEGEIFDKGLRPHASIYHYLMYKKLDGTSEKKKNQYLQPFAACMDAAVLINECSSRSHMRDIIFHYFSVELSCKQLLSRSDHVHGERNAERRRRRPCGLLPTPTSKRRRKKEGGRGTRFIEIFGKKHSLNVRIRISDYPTAP